MQKPQGYAIIQGSDTVHLYFKNFLYFKILLLFYFIFFFFFKTEIVSNSLVWHNRRDIDGTSQ